MLANDRVRLTMDYHPPRRGRRDYRSRLYVDGKRRRNADTYTHFVRIFTDPDGQEPLPGRLAPMPPIRPLEQAPPEIQAAAANLITRLRRAGLDYELRAGFDGYRWLLGIDAGDGDGEGDGIRCFFAPCASNKNRWCGYGLRPQQVVRGGIDVTDAADQKLEAVVRRLLSSGDPTAPGPDGDADPTDAQAPANTGTSRKGTVMRN